MSWSRSTGRKRRSWTAPPPILSGRSIRSASLSRRVRAAISRSSSRFGCDRDGGFAEFLPAESGFRLDVEIDFQSSAIGRQRRVFDLDPATFRREIARARTFGFLRDVQALWQAGFALGSSLENSVAIDGDAILNPEGLRYADEFVRHKALDAIGDLSLAGAPIIGLYRTYRPGHKLNALALEALFEHRSAYELLEAPTMPAAGIRARVGGAHVPAGAAAFAAAD